MPSRSTDSTRIAPALLLAVLVMSVLAPAVFGQTAASGQRPKTHLIEVDTNVRLEVLDWGGSGRTLVLLAGLGDTAHVYERFALRFTSHFRVLGVTRRGFGTSSKPQSGYSAERLANDVVSLLDALNIERPVLVGHSVAGEELSSIGARNANRIAALIYLDAAWDRTYVPPQETKKNDGGDFDKVGIQSEPKPDPTRFDPEAAIRAGIQKPGYAHITIPALALYAAPRTWKEMMPDAPDFTKADQVAAADKVVAQMAKMRKNMADQFRSGVAKSRVVEIPGASHYLFKTNEDDVVREMLVFLGGLNR